MLVVGKMMAGDWGWRKERYPLHATRIDLRFAELKDPVKDKLKRFGLFSELGEGSFFPTVDAAVRSYLDTHSVDWLHSEDRRP